jgi:hydrogenase maturation protease
MTRHVLVVGYGNTLRRDDGVGWRLAARLDADPRLAGVAVIQRHQLTPDLALDMSTAELVVLVDADDGLAPGTIAIGAVQPDPTAQTRWSHHTDPATLLALTEQLYGRTPRVVVVRCGVQSLDVGDELTPGVEAAVPLVIDAIVELVRSPSAAGGRTRPAAG